MEAIYGWLLLAVVSTAHAYPFFRHQIPNGESVPHPCKEGVWIGVGHRNELGSGPRNPFGMAFAKNGMVWNRTLCEMDSDGDGRTNGEELGDPGCVWTPGRNPSGSASSHPGICEPLTDSRCAADQSFVSCQDVTCAAINDPDTFQRTYRYPAMQIPTSTKSTWCRPFELPMMEDLHLVATTPFVDNMDVLQSVLLYGCSFDTPESLGDALNTTYQCEMNLHENCGDLLASWVLGQSGTCLHSNAGFRVGSKGMKYGVLEIHYRNPMQLTGQEDSSGMNLFFTSRLRENDAAVLTIGQLTLEIPPGSLWHEQTATCRQQCMRTTLSGPVYVTNVQHHMHYLGVRQTTSLEKDGSVEILAVDETYHYEHPESHALSTLRTVTQTDQLSTTCVYRSADKTKTTFFGLTLQDEMCFSFLTVYPKSNLIKTNCNSIRDFGLCEIESGTLRGCNLVKLGDSHHPETVALFDPIVKHCDNTGTTCLSECKKAILKARQDPCLQPEVLRLVEEGSFRTDNVTAKVALYELFTGLHSCDVEIALDSQKTTSGFMPIAPSFALLVTIASLFL